MNKKKGYTGEEVGQAFLKAHEEILIGHDLLMIGVAFLGLIILLLIWL